MNYLVDFVNTATEQEVTDYLALNNCSLVKMFSSFDKVYLVSADTEPPKTDLIERVFLDNPTGIQLLDAVPMEISSEIDTIALDDEKNWWKVASINDIDFSAESYDFRIYGKNSTVYLMDSGIDHTHSEFSESSIELFYSFDGTFTDISGHGTALASLINGKTCGLTNAKIKVVKIFNQGSPTLVSDIVAAFDAIIADLPNVKYAVVNMSWSIPRNEYIDHKISLLVSAGVIAVAAAGNSGMPIDNVTPAALPEVLTIGSYNQDFEPCDFSNYTGQVDLSLTQNQTNFGSLDGWAPGINLYVALPNNRYGYVAGTSFSAAIHTGALAFDVDFMCFINGTELVPCLSEEIGWTVTYNSLSRQNILSLQNQYAGSINKISTYAGNSVSMLPVDRIKKFYAVVSDVYACRPVCTRADVASISIEPALPLGLEFVSPGWIIGKVTLDESDPDYVISDHVATIVTHSGQTIEHSFQVSIKKDSLDPNTLPPELTWVTAQGATCWSGPNSCAQPCPFGNPGALLGTCSYVKGTPTCPTCWS